MSSDLNLPPSSAVNPEKNHAYRDFFANLDESGIDYCMLRNFNELGEARDLDLLCAPWSMTRVGLIFANALNKFGWKVIHRQDRIRGVVFKAVKVLMSDADDDIDALTYEFIELDLTAYESLYLSEPQLRKAGLAERSFIDDIEVTAHQYDGVPITIPSERWQFLFLINRLLYKPKKSYLEEVKVLAKSPDIKKIVNSLPQWREVEQADSPQALPQDILIQISKAAYQGLRKSPSRINRISACGAIILRKFVSAFRRKAVVVTFSGPDGAGKTTTNMNSTQYISSVLSLKARNLKHLYFLNSMFGRQARTLQTKMRGISEDNVEAIERDRGTDRTWRMRRFVGLLLVIFQYLPGLLIARTWTRLGINVIVDTSFLDAFVKGHRPKFTVLENLFVPLFPLADASILMVSKESVIVARKPELSCDEITTYYQRIEALSELSRGDVRQIRSDVPVPATLLAVFNEINEALERIVLRR